MFLSRVDLLGVKGTLCNLRLGFQMKLFFNKIFKYSIGFLKNLHFVYVVPCQQPSNRLSLPWNVSLRGDIIMIIATSFLQEVLGQAP